MQRFKTKCHLQHMRSAESSQRIEDGRYLELNPEHLEQFLQAIGRELQVDQTRVDELIHGTVCQGVSDGEMGVPRVRRAGRWTCAG